MTLVDQQLKRRRLDDTCTKQLENPTDSRRFWCGRIVTDGDEKWAFYRNSANRAKVWIQFDAQHTTAQVVAKQDRFAQKIMLCLMEFRRDI